MNKPKRWYLLGSDGREEGPFTDELLAAYFEFHLDGLQGLRLRRAKGDAKGEWVLSGEMCEYLDPVCRLCTVYAERDRVAWCGSVPMSIAGRDLPADCPYVAGVDGYETGLDYRRAK